MKIALRVCFAAAVTEVARTPSSESGPAKLLPQEPPSASQHQAAMAVSCVCGHLCFISIDFVHRLA